MKTKCTFGKLLKAHRAMRMMTQADLAAKVGCATITISRLERDSQDPALSLYFALCDALGVTPNALQPDGPR